MQYAVSAPVAYHRGGSGGGAIGAIAPP